MCTGIAIDNVTSEENDTLTREAAEHKSSEQPAAETLHIEEDEDRHNFALAKDGAKVGIFLLDDQLVLR